MSRMWLAAAVWVWLACACRFDVKGLDEGAAPVDAAARDAEISDAAVDAPPDGPPADAPPCVDQDGDGHQTPTMEGVDCGPEPDCDDQDPDVHPGQTSFFDLAATSGGFDYDCNGTEERFDDTAGGDCQDNWFSCDGTGWVGGVPACGAPGTWHICADQDGCMETKSTQVRMACR